MIHGLFYNQSLAFLSVVTAIMKLHEHLAWEKLVITQGEFASYASRKQIFNILDFVFNNKPQHT